jgi:hypothetical protein
MYVRRSRTRTATQGPGEAAREERYGSAVSAVTQTNDSAESGRRLQKAPRINAKGQVSAAVRLARR